MSNITLSFKKAAIRVLSESSEPLSASRITDIALDKGYLATTGNTPNATMSAQLYTDIQSKQERSKFVKISPGIFGLRDSKEQLNSPLALLNQSNKESKAELLGLLRSMDPYQFEFLVADLLTKIGYEDVEVTKRSGDKGIDVNATLTVGGVTSVKTVIQAKRFSKTNKINGSVITQLRGSAEVDQRGLVITTSTFLKSAKEESIAPNKMPVSLIDGNKLVELLVKYKIGVSTKSVEILDVDEEYFLNIDVDNQNSSSLSRSLWPLPGGIWSYFETLLLMLEYISKHSDIDKITQWIISEFENVSSNSSVNGYLNVLRNTGLIKKDVESLVLTNDGERVRTEKNKDLVFQIFSAKILVFQELFEFVRNSDAPVSEDEALDYVNENFDMKWNTTAQVKYRLLWLSNLDCILKVGTKYKVK